MHTIVRTQKHQDEWAVGEAEAWEVGHQGLVLAQSLACWDA